MLPDPRETWSLADIATLSGQAIGKISKWGPRGVTMCSMLEIEAMACALIWLNVQAVEADQPPPDDFLQPFQHALKEASHEQV